MYSLRTSIALSTNFCSTAMRARAAASRIPCPAQRATVMPIKPTIAVPRTPPTDNTADIASQLAAMSISKPGKRSPTDSRLTVKQRSQASERIQARKDAVAARLRRPTQPPVPTRRPVKSRTSPSVSTPSSALPPSVPKVPTSSKPTPRMSSRDVSSTSTKARPLTTQRLAMGSMRALGPFARPRSHGIVIVRRELDNGLVANGHIAAHTEIHDHLWDIPSRIPTMKWFRGSAAYCEARPHVYNSPGNRGYGLRRVGRPCRCHSSQAPGPYPHRWLRPREWITTPAEADTVDNNRPRRVHFNETVTVGSFEKWFVDAYGKVEYSTDPATIEDDDRAVNDFNSTWQQLMDEGFPDDED